MMSPPISQALPVVLVVEDEPLLRMLAVEVVEEAGFIAIEARDADEAVILLESRSDITLLFTDINMPGSMDVLKLAHAVRDRWPRSRSSLCPENSSFSRLICHRTVASSESLTRRPRWSRNFVRSSGPLSELGSG
jgi:DNA-binding NtrC family response regulator